MHPKLPAVPLACLLAAAPAASAAPAPPVGTRYVHADHRGDVALATDAGGIPVGRNVHRPWGGKRPLTVGEATARRTFDGWDNDGIVGLLYAGARWYDHHVGRFLSVDPARQGIYATLAGAPLAHVDPDGRVWYRFLTARGTPAFRIEGKGPPRFREVRLRYEPVVEKSELRRVADDGDVPHATDVFLYLDDSVHAGHRSWNAAWAHGMIRAELYSVEQRKALLAAYVADHEGQSLNALSRARTNLGEWLRLNRTLDDGSAPPVPRPAEHPAPRSGRVDTSLRGVPVLRLSATPSPGPGVAIERPDPVRGPVTRGPRALAVQQPVFPVIA